MNKYDKRYDIRLADKQDIPEIMQYLNDYWKEGHILSVDRNMFEYEFLDGDRINMILAIEKSTSCIEAIYGFLPCSKTVSMEKKDVWGSLWSVNNKHDNIPLLGVEMAKRAYSIIACRMFIGSGVNPKTAIPLRQMLLKDKVGKMEQYYFLNPLEEEFSICKISQRKKCSYIDDTGIEIINIANMKELKNVFNVEDYDVYPYKDNWYIEKRYFKHPYYTYELLGVKKNSKIELVIVGREICVNNKKIYRIVDCLGKYDMFSYTGNYWFNRLINDKYEYVDFYEFGLKKEILENAGFTYRDDEDPNIIPNYFEPFLKENVDIWVHYKYDGTTFFKGDSDQDRPNLLRTGNE